jgi:hypothetical protein
VKTTMAMTLIYEGAILLGLVWCLLFLCVNVIGPTMEQDLWAIRINNSYFVELSIILHFVFLWEVDAFIVFKYFVITLMGKMS